MQYSYFNDDLFMHSVVNTINSRTSADNLSENEMIYGADIGFLSQLESQGVEWWMTMEIQEMLLSC